MKKGCNELFSMFQKKKQLAEEKSEYVIYEKEVAIRDIKKGLGVNPFMPYEISNPYQLDESILNLRFVG